MENRIIRTVLALWLLVVMVSCMKPSSGDDSKAPSTPSLSPMPKTTAYFTETPFQAVPTLDSTVAADIPDSLVDGLIAFVAIGNDGQYIMTMSLSDHKTVKIISSPNEFFYSPSSSPNGEWLAFIKETRSHQSDMYRINLETNEVEQLTFDGKPKSTLDWSPDGNYIAFSFRDEKTKDIYLLELKNETVQNLTKSSVDEDFPVWDPSGKRIAFLSFDPNNYGVGGHIEMIQIDGQGRQEIKNALAWTGKIDWSPDGQKIVFRSNDACGDIYTINVDGTDLKQLTHMPGGEKDPIWTIDGMHIIFASSDFICDHKEGGEPLLYDWQLNILDLKNSISIPILSDKNQSFFNLDWISSD